MQATASHKLRASKACVHCRASKRRCDANIPCNRCLAKGLDCSLSSSPSSQFGHRSLNEREVATENNAIILDLPRGAHSTGMYLIDRYFDHIAPHWPIVERQDLAIKPFAPPLLSRSICLLVASYFSEDQENDPVVSDLLESVKQIFDVSRVVAMPCLWCLQSLLLLIACPRVPQRPILIVAACRMALTMGLNRTQNSRLILFWSSLVASNWDSLRRGRGPSRRNNRPCPDLRSVAPAEEPDNSSFFGNLFSMISQADKARRFQTINNNGSCWKPENLPANLPANNHEEAEGLRQLALVTSSFLQGDLDIYGSSIDLQMVRKLHAANLDPFHFILQKFSEKEEKK